MQRHDVNTMLLFLAVVEAGSFTLAAERLNMPKANLSRKIAQLEASVGITLLERTTRSQHLTEAGRNYLAHCREIKAQVELANAAVEKALNVVSGELKVGVSVGMGHEILKPVLSQFMHENPQISMSLNLLNHRVDVIEEGFDLVIRIGTLEDSRLVAKRLGKVTRRLYSSPQYLERCAEVTGPDAISHLDVLLMSSIQTAQTMVLVNRQETCEINIHPRMRVDDYVVLKQMVIEGVGVAILPDYMCQTALGKDQLVQLLPDWQLPEVEVYALYPKHRLNIPKVKTFVEFIQHVFTVRLNLS
ncbi:LysR family transcriptional regulator [Pseudoalteromonas sp. SMS1]|uniref:LysR family transcriptional regulator n=1 Tax=Pseudoalteromonas sp. SMS1 TaxID=2908894 RepID=UPI001F3FF4CC|nr:LysR family transcriptional regulator [Pseudoalteromonas sp. SMS1]MCF2857703.1 LysR family transcriptional regulator [Pseudoalteromonas sp. SMS1]